MDGRNKLTSKNFEHLEPGHFEVDWWLVWMINFCSTGWVRQLLCSFFRLFRYELFERIQISFQLHSMQPDDKTDIGVSCKDHPYIFVPVIKYLHIVFFVIFHHFARYVTLIQYDCRFELSYMHYNLESIIDCNGQVRIKTKIYLAIWYAILW